MNSLDCIYIQIYVDSKVLDREHGVESACSFETECKHDLKCGIRCSFSHDMSCYYIFRTSTQNYDCECMMLCATLKKKMFEIHKQQTQSVMPVVASHKKSKDPVTVRFGEILSCGITQDVICVCSD